MDPAQSARRRLGAVLAHTAADPAAAAASAQGGGRVTGVAEASVGPLMDRWAAKLSGYAAPLLPAPPAPEERPTAALPAGAGDTLTAAQVESWRERGVSVVDGVWPEELIGQLRRELDPKGRPGVIGAGVEFPSMDCASMNTLVLHPRIVRAVAQLLGSSKLRVAQAEGWSKTGRDLAPQPAFSNVQRHFNGI